MTYRILPHIDPTPVDVALAPRRQRLEDAVADMGNGAVIGDDRRVVAFHERHLERLSRGYGTVSA